MNIDSIIYDKWKDALPMHVSDQLSYNAFIKCFANLDLPLQPEYRYIHVNTLYFMAVVH